MISKLLILNFDTFNFTVMAFSPIINSIYLYYNVILSYKKTVCFKIKLIYFLKCN